MVERVVTSGGAERRELAHAEEPLKSISAKSLSESEPSPLSEEIQLSLPDFKAPSQLGNDWQSDTDDSTTVASTSLVRRKPTRRAGKRAKHRPCHKRWKELAQAQADGGETSQQVAIEIE